MTGIALRWFAAAALSAVLIVGLCRFAADVLKIEPGSRSGAVERLTGVEMEPKRVEGTIRVTGSQCVRGGAQTSRRGGLGAQLLEAGRPRGRLSALDAAKFPSCPQPAARRALPPARMLPPAADRSRKAAGRRRAGEAGREVPGLDFAPKRRRIPGRPTADGALKAALTPPSRLPRLQKLPARSSTDVPVEARVEVGEPVPPPPTPKRLPAPAVPLPARFR